MDKDRTIRIAKNEGHDGIIVIDRAMGLGKNKEPEKLIVAFEPTQIKSAIGNDGSFDAGNPDITKSFSNDF